MMTSCSHIEPVSNKAWSLVAETNVNIFVLKSHNKLQLELIKNQKNCKNSISFDFG